MASVYYSGAIEQWGMTIPRFSRGRYVANRKLELYNVGYLYPPPISSPRSIHRCIYVYNGADSEAIVVLSVAGPFPSGRPETLYIALGSSTPTFYVDYLADEDATPPIVGSWGTSLNLTIPSRSAFPVWLRLTFTDASTPTKDAYFTLQLGGNPVSHIVYSYQENEVVLPLALWEASRHGMRLSGSLVGTGTTPPPVYTPRGFLKSSVQSVVAAYPLVDAFAESDYAKKVISVIAIAIAEFWVRADAAARFSSQVFSRLGDAMSIFGVPKELPSDALVNITSTVVTERGDALAHFATGLVEKLCDVLANIGFERFSYRADALVHLGTEWVKRGDALTFFAVDVEEQHGDANIQLLTPDDILRLSPLPRNSVWGVSIIPPLQTVTVRAIFNNSTLHATSLQENSRVRALYSSDGIFWLPLALVPIYPNKLERSLQRGFVRFRNERDDWVVVVWALVRYN